MAGLDREALRGCNGVLQLLHQRQQSCLPSAARSHTHGASNCHKAAQPLQQLMRLVVAFDILACTAWQALSAQLGGMTLGAEQLLQGRCLPHVLHL